jgi:hypothetical protein
MIKKAVNKAELKKRENIFAYTRQNMKYCCRSFPLTEEKT